MSEVSLISMGGGCSHGGEEEEGRGCKPPSRKVFDFELFHVLFEAT